MFDLCRLFNLLLLDCSCITQRLTCLVTTKLLFMYWKWCTSDSTLFFAHSKILRHCTGILTFCSNFAAFIDISVIIYCQLQWNFRIIKFSYDSYGMSSVYRKWHFPSKWESIINSSRQHFQFLLALHHSSALHCSWALRSTLFLI